MKTRLKVEHNLIYFKRYARWYHWITIPWCVGGLGVIFVIKQLLKGNFKVVGALVQGFFNALGRLSFKVVPTFALGNEIDPALLSRDPAVAAEYAADPLVHDRISSRLFTEWQRATQQVLARAFQFCCGTLSSQPRGGFRSRQDKEQPARENPARQHPLQHG